MTDTRKDLPPTGSANFLEKVREAVSTYLGSRGDRLDRGLTVRDLYDAGIIDLKEGFLAGGGGLSPVKGVGASVAQAVEKDLTPPPTPTGFAVSAAISNIFIEHDVPTYTPGHGHNRTVVYGVTYTTGPLPVFTDAVKITEFPGTVFAHPSQPATQWRLWIKWLSNDGVLSLIPAGGTNGLGVTTGQDVTLLVKAMTGPGNPFTVLAASTTIGGVVFPAGTYSTQSFILDAQITNAKIANLAVDSAKIASLAASKITSGAITVGQTISSANYIAGTSGWSINGGGQVEFSNAVVRGGVYASYGSFAGQLIAATGTFAGSLSAATGTFAGSLSAATGTFSGSLSAATGTFSGNLSAVGGTFVGALDVKSATSGARLEIKSDVIKVFDAAGALRVQIGNLDV